VIGVTIFLFSFLVSALISSYTKVEFGTVAAVTRFGRLTGTVFHPGLNWRSPFIESVTKVRTQVQSYETSDQPESSQADFRDFAVGAQTMDGQQISIKYTVLFRFPPTDETAGILQSIGNMDEVVENVVKAYSRNLVRLLAQSYSAEELYGGDMIFHYQKTVLDELYTKFEKFGHGLILDDFTVRKIDFDPDYILSIEQQQIAQENIETQQYASQAAEYERDKAIRLGEAEKQNKILMAEAEAAQIKLKADADAYSIEVQGKALRANPSMIQWQFVQNLQDVSWGLIPSDSVTPFLPLEMPK
jgi:regulator of protease activity HflC (stomatin/prohibitin superfamily)